MLQEELWNHPRTRVHGGKTQSMAVWWAPTTSMRCVITPVPTVEQEIKVLGSNLGRADFVDAHLLRTTREHSVLLERIPSLLELQLHLVHCAAAKATCLLRVLPPTMMRRFAEDHDDGLRSRLCQLLCVLQTKETQFVPLTQCPSYWEVWGG